MHSKSEKIRKMMAGLEAKVELDDKSTTPAINLDNAATTPPFKGVMEHINKELCFYGSIGRGKGQKSEHATTVYSNGRDTIKKFFGADSDAYTVCYANNTTDAINKLASALIQSPDDLVLTTRMEHHANDLPWRERATTLYAEVDELGRLNMDDLEQILIAHSGKIKYVTVTAASNVTGYLNDVHYIAKLAHEHGAYLIVDGAQVAAHYEVSLLGETPEENIDFFVFSAHKMYSPYGGGGIVGRIDLLDLNFPKFYGGGIVDSVSDTGAIYHDAPDSFEAGSPNYASIVGMLTTMDILKYEIGFDYLQSHERQLLEKTIAGLRSIPGVTLYGDSDDLSDRVGIVTFNIAGLTPIETAGILASHYGIATRHAAFCAHPYVRRLTGEVGDEAPVGMVRASFGIYTSDSEIETFLDAVAHIANNDYMQKKAKHHFLKTWHIHIGKPHDRG